MQAPVDPKDPKQGVLRNHLKALEAQGKHDPRLDAGTIPEGCGYLWELFCTVRQGVAEGFSGARITWRDLVDYQDVSGVCLDAFEAEAIMAIDAALRAGFAGDDDGS